MIPRRDGDHDGPERESVEGRALSGIDAATAMGSHCDHEHGSSTISYSAATTGSLGATSTATDESLVQRVSRTDGLGRLRAVTESGISATTSYAYDVLGNLQTVTPALGTGTRTFNYSSLGRLTSATNPESGTVSYTYDGNGNLKTRTRGGYTTNFYYNQRNQPTQTTYGDGTPTVNYAYTKDWLTSVSNTSATANRTYDGLGRVSTSSPVMGSTYSFSYSYNLADGLVSITLPSTRVLTTTYDFTGRPNGLSGVFSGSTKSYVSSVTYAPHGALQSGSRNQR